MATAENAEAAKKPYGIALVLTMLGTALLGVAMGVVGGLLVGLVALAAMCFAWSAILWKTGDRIWNGEHENAG